MKAAKFKIGQWVRFDGSVDLHKKEFQITGVVPGAEPLYELNHCSNREGLIRESDLISMDEYEDIARRNQSSADADAKAEGK